ncbi:hypothetical protein GCM10007417_04720 [Glycocaulis alkaliphilus]|nr:hypothetical protein GCM10007417_04720 [Glycocaulis alkaliphilus]
MRIDMKRQRAHVGREAGGIAEKHIVRVDGRNAAILQSVRPRLGLALQALRECNQLSRILCKDRRAASGEQEKACGEGAYELHWNTGL